MAADSASTEPDVTDVAAALRVSIGLLLRQHAPGPARGELTVPETSALTRLDRGRSGHVQRAGPGGADQRAVDGGHAGALEARGLVARHPDADDGRRVVLSVTDAAAAGAQDKRATRGSTSSPGPCRPFTPAELSQLTAAAPLLERLARSI